MNQLAVQRSRMQPIAIGLLGLFMGGLGLASLISGLVQGFKPVPVAIGLMMLVMFGLVFSLSRRGHARSVKRFTSEGLERNDGRFLAWSALDRVVYQIRTLGSQKKLWRIEIWFRDGESAWLLPLRVVNSHEVSELVARLPCEHTEQEV